VFGLQSFRASLFVGHAPRTKDAGRCLRCVDIDAYLVRHSGFLTSPAQSLQALRCQPRHRRCPTHHRQQSICIHLKIIVTVCLALPYCTLCAHPHTQATLYPILVPIDLPCGPDLLEFAESRLVFCRGDNRFLGLQRFLRAWSAVLGRSSWRLGHHSDIERGVASVGTNRRTTYHQVFQSLDCLLE
jgi:hypothetical protein